VTLPQTAGNGHDAGNEPHPGRPVEVVVVGGLDPGGGAGLLRDVATAAARGARARTVGTAWTEQGPGVHEVEPRPPEGVRRGLGLALAAGAGAVKIGMSVGPATAAAILEALGGYGGPVVLDPVLASSRGGALWQGEPAGLLPLARRATLLTPNAGEAAALTGLPARTTDDLESAARCLVEREGLLAVLVKGGHVDTDGETVVDVLAAANEVRRFRRPRAPGTSPRGTGCALATAIAIELGRGAPLEQAVEIAGAWLGAAIAAAVTIGDERRL
jgi:hydroxymethylpyrimidine kinase/phosphomethylpyrimidine kinase